MAKHLPWLKAAALALCACGLGGSAVMAARATAHPAAPTPYLLATGPAPLRFQSPRPLSRPVWPPLWPPDRPAAGPITPATNPAQSPMTLTTTTNRPAATVSVTSASPGPALPPTPAGPLPLPTPEDRDFWSSQVLDPQLLLEYLAPLSTNTALRGRFLSPAFVPPVTPWPTPSSRATYESR